MSRVDDAVTNGKTIYNVNIFNTNNFQVNNYLSWSQGDSKAYDAKPHFMRGPSNSKNYYNEFFSDATSAKRQLSLTPTFDSRKEIMDKTAPETPSVILEGQQTKEATAKRALPKGPEGREYYNDHLSELTGYVLIALGITFFVAIIFCALLSKFLTEPSHSIIKAIKADNYYCWLLPLMIPTTVVAVYANWLSMKFFRHS
eukprot:TRINITY_DN3947_c0_g1_i1.p1 TRINITY_DN3947_c0_g1~~TRINITY_DN3947_c0_g1_i1.p1  ORF type:complete len:200 (-),score=41.41 TRINITY_DN3947_c0_g1_i1:87-686(-)